MRYLFLKWEHSIFVPRYKWFFSPNSRRFDPLLSGCVSAIIFLELRAAFSPRPLYCRFFCGFAPKKNHSLPRSGAPSVSCLNFSPGSSAPVILRALRAKLFPRLLHGNFFSCKLCSIHTKVCPVSRAGVASSSIFSQVAPDFSPATARPFFSPEQSAPCSLGISPLNSGSYDYNDSHESPYAIITTRTDRKFAILACYKSLRFYNSHESLLREWYDSHQSKISR